MESYNENLKKTVSSLEKALQEKTDENEKFKEENKVLVEKFSICSVEELEKKLEKSEEQITVLKDQCKEYMTKNKELLKENKEIKFDLQSYKYKLIDTKNKLLDSEINNLKIKKSKNPLVGKRP